MTLSATPLEKILQAVNEKYGTSFEGWSQLPTVYEVGDTVPDWNAYEKISNLRWAIQFAGTNGVIGIVEENTYKVYSNNVDKMLIASDSGIIVGMQSYSSDFGNFMMQKLINAGLNIQSIEQLTTSLIEGDNVPYWSLYNITK